MSRNQREGYYRGYLGKRHRRGARNFSWQSARHSVVSDGTVFILDKWMNK